MNIETTQLINGIKKNIPIEQIKKIIHSGADVKIKDKKGNTLLHLAAIHGNVSAIKFLLSKKFNFRRKNKKGNTPLYLAIRHCHYNAAKAILDSKEVNVSKDKKSEMMENKNKEGKTALYAALNSKKEAERFVTLLVNKHDVNVNTENKIFCSSITPLYIAVKLRLYNITELLINNGANINTKNTQKGITSLHLASRNNDEKMVKILLSYKGTNINCISFSIKNTALHFAAEEGHLKILKLLLNAGADKDFLDLNGRTPLMAAVDNEKTNIVETLLQYGVDVEKKGASADSALTIAINKGYNKIIKLLLPHIITFNDIEYDDNSYLHLTITEGNIKATRALLETGCGVNYVNKQKQTPLEAAIRTEKIPLDIFDLLLQFGAKPNDRSHNGEPFLFLAVEKKHYGAAATLINHGADIKDALNYATTKGFIKASKFLADQLIEKNRVNMIASDVYRFFSSNTHSPNPELLSPINNFDK